MGVIHREMRALGSLIMRSADAHQVPAGGALAVDRDGFSAAVEAAISYEKDIMPGVVEVVTKRGKPVMAEILAQFGAAKASHIDPDQYPELLAAIRDALASAA